MGQIMSHFRLFKRSIYNYFKEKGTAKNVRLTAKMLISAIYARLRGAIRASIYRYRVAESLLIHRKELADAEHFFEGFSVVERNSWEVNKQQKYIV